MESKHTPGTMSAATLIFDQLNRLTPKPLADRGDTIDGIASIIDEHTNAPGLLEACKALIANVEEQERRVGGKVEWHPSVGMIRNAIADAER